MLEYIYMGIITLFVIGLLVVGFVMDKDDVDRRDD